MVTKPNHYSKNSKKNFEHSNHIYRTIFALSSESILKVYEKMGACEYRHSRNSGRKKFGKSFSSPKNFLKKNRRIQKGPYRRKLPSPYPPVLNNPGIYDIMCL
jgi:hypothetical protein